MENNSKLMQYLIRQCHNPTGIVGKVMIKIWNNTFMPMALWGLGNIHLNTNDTVLEVGCGGGKFINYLSQSQHRGEIYGIDISSESIATATKLNKTYVENGTVKLVATSAEDLPTFHHKFDKAFAIQTHMYWSDIETSVLAINNNLTDNGEFNIICEKDKIMYHMPRYINPNDMIAMLKQQSFKSVNMFQTENWIQYKCIK